MYTYYFFKTAYLNCVFVLYFVPVCIYMRLKWNFKVTLDVDFIYKTIVKIFELILNVVFEIILDVDAVRLFG